MWRSRWYTFSGQARWFTVLVDHSGFVLSLIPKLARLLVWPATCCCFKCVRDKDGRIGVQDISPLGAVALASFRLRVVPQYDEYDIEYIWRWSFDMWRAWCRQISGSCRAVTTSDLKPHDIQNRSTVSRRMSSDCLASTVYDLSARSRSWSVVMCVAQDILTMSCRCFKDFESHETRNLLQGLSAGIPCKPLFFLSTYL